MAWRTRARTLLALLKRNERHLLGQTRLNSREEFGSRHANPCLANLLSRIYGSTPHRTTMVQGDRPVPSTTPLVSNRYQPFAVNHRLLRDDGYGQPRSVQRLYHHASHPPFGSQEAR